MTLSHLPWSIGERNRGGDKEEEEKERNHSQLFAPVRRGEERRRRSRRRRRRRRAKITSNCPPGFLVVLQSLGDQLCDL